MLETPDGRTFLYDAGALRAENSDSAVGQRACDRVRRVGFEDDAVKVRDGNGLRVLVHDADLRWPDTLSEGPDGTIYVTSSHIQDMPYFKPGNPAAVPTKLFRIETAR